MVGSFRAARDSGDRSAGFTMVEVLVVMAIVAILTAVAYPSYVNYITKSNRAAAEGFMLEVSGRQERYLLDNRGYAADIGLLTTGGLTIPQTVSDVYTITTVSPRTGVTTPSYEIIAMPLTKQAARDAKCGILGIYETGEKVASGSAGARVCWEK